MFDNHLLSEGTDPLKLAEMTLKAVQDLTTQLAQKDEQIRELEQQLEQQRNDPWTSSVTYDNVVEMIAAYEDSGVRDEARKVFEPLLKKELKRQLLRDIRRKVKELQTADDDEPQEGTVVSKKLMTDEAKELMSELVEAGILNEEWQAVGLSGTERSLVAKAVCDRLLINDVWQVFGKLWREKPETLRGYLNKALDQKKSLEFQEKLKEILD